VSFGTAPPPPPLPPGGARAVQVGKETCPAARLIPVIEVIVRSLKNQLLLLARL
jgi:hypothetical protein